MPTPGTDCHITLQHTSVNSGTAVGFIIKADKRGPLVQVSRPRYGLPVWSDQGAAPKTLRFTVLGLPRLLTSAGGDYASTAAQVRTFLDAFFATTTPITLATALVSYTVMWVDLSEHQYMDGAEWVIELRTTT